MKTLAIIPARGGSKSVPRKNIRLVAGKPLIAYTIQAAINSKNINYFLTSTDDLEIADIAKNLGSPILIRPKELSDDDTPMIKVVIHVMNHFPNYDSILILQPTAPLRTTEDIDGSLEILNQAETDSVISVYQVSDNHPARMYKIVGNKLIPYDEKYSQLRRQDLPPIYHRNGAIYAAKRELIEKFHTLMGPNAKPYIMPRNRSINIDDEMDLAFLDFIISHNVQL